MSIISKIEGKFPKLVQFVKFGLVGVMNTVVDFAVLNLMSWMTGIKSGGEIFVINSVSTFVAILNSYFFNKYWTFKAKDTNTKKGVEFVQFLVVSLVGVVINGGIVYLVTTFVDPWFGLSETLWLNAGKIAATIISLVWNYIGYKLWVFKGK